MRKNRTATATIRIPRMIFSFFPKRFFFRQHKAANLFKIHLLSYSNIISAADSRFSRTAAQKKVSSFRRSIISKNFKIRNLRPHTLQRISHGRVMKVTRNINIEAVLPLLIRQRHRFDVT